MTSRHLLRILSLVLVAVAVLALVSACGDDDDDDGGGDDGGDGGSIDVSGVDELSDGTLTVGSDIAYAPIEFYEEGTDNEMGLDVDLIRAMAELMGVEVTFEQVADFAGIVGDLQTKRYDIVMSAISITPERQAEIDFVAYFGPVGTGILVQTGNPEGFGAVEDLCGNSVGAQQGTYQVDQMEALNDDACSADPIDIQTFPDNPAVIQELTLGRIVAALMDDPVAAYSADQSEGDLVELAVTGFEAAAYGIGVRQDSTALNEALQAALEGIRENGEYDAILEKWGQTQFAFGN